MKRILKRKYQVGGGVGQENQYFNSMSYMTPNMPTFDQWQQQSGVIEPIGNDVIPSTPGNRWRNPWADQQQNSAAPVVEQPIVNTPVQDYNVPNTQETPYTDYVQGDYNLNGETNTLDNLDKNNQSSGANNQDWNYVQGDNNLDGSVNLSDTIDKNGNRVGENPLDNYNGGNIQFNNPYGGVDLQSAAGTLGSSIENKNPLGIVAGGLKLATGLGRGIFGAMGQQRRNNQVMKDYYQKQRDGMTTVQYAEDGGYFQKGGAYIPVDKSDLGAINNASGVEFTLDGAQELFGKEPVSNQGIPGSTKKKRFSDLTKQRIVDVTSGTNRYTPDGGMIVGDYKKVWTGQKPEEYVGKKTPVEGEDFIYMNPNQYKDFQTTDNYKQYKAGYPNTDVTQVFQKGGEMNLAKALTGEYMTGMDKNNPMTAPNAEIESGEYIKDPNQEVQQVIGDTHEKGGEDVALEEGTQILSDHLKIGAKLAREFRKEYDIDVKSKDTYATVMDKYSKKIGLTKIVEEQEKIIEDIEKQNKETEDEETLGLNVQHLSNKLNELEKEKAPLEEARKKLFDDLFEEQEESKPKEENEGGDYFEDGGILKELADKHGVSYERAKALFQDGGGYTEKQRRERFKDFYKQAVNLGYEGDANPDAQNLNTEAGKLQTWMANNYPEVVSAYAKQVDMTAKGVDILKQRNPELFVKSGISPLKPSAAYTSEEKALLKGQLEQAGLATDDFWKEQFQDNKWTFRYPQVPLSGGINQQPATNNGIPIVSPILPGNDSIDDGEEIISPEVDVTSVADDGYNKMNMLLLPDQTPMLPGSLQPHLKITRRFDRVNPALLSPEQNIVETNRQQSYIADQVNNIPGAQRAAALSNLSASTQENLNKVITQTNQFNSQATSQADARNAQIQAAEENARAMDALSFEQRQLRAKSLTDNDINNYYNTIQANNVRNYNEVNNLNAVNAMADHYQFDGQGYVQIDRPTFGTDNQFALTPAEQLVKAQREEEARRKAETSKKRAKFGGRFKNS